MNAENGKKQCFVIAPIGETESETRKRSDQILKHIIRPAMAQCGYEAIRADEIDKPGIITSQVIQRVVGDPLVIADLTETNPNVFYELAIRHAIRKPLIQIIKKGERIPFDVAGTRTIHVDHHDLDSVEVAKKEIIAQTKALEADNSDIETPISIALDLQLLRQSDNPEDRSLADVLGIVSEIRGSLVKIEARVTDAFSASVNDDIVKSIRDIIPQIEQKLAFYMDVKRRRLDPFILQEIAGAGTGQPMDPTGLLITLSAFKDELPWLYELGLEVYRDLKQNDFRSASWVVTRMAAAIETFSHSPYADATVLNRRDVRQLFNELPVVLNRLIRAMREQKRVPAAKAAPKANPTASR